MNDFILESPTYGPAETAPCLTVPSFDVPASRERSPPRLDEVVRTSADARRGVKPFPHPFPARMPIEIAAALVESVTEHGDVVLDPMMGSGVVPKAAALQGRQGVGTDLDPLAVAQARALCADIGREEFDRLCEELAEGARSILGSAALHERRRSLPDEDARFLDYWFPPEHVDELFALTSTLDKVADARTWPVGAVLISSLIVSRGSGASFAMDLSRSRPHKVGSKKPRSPFADWHRKVVQFRRYYASQPIVTMQPVLRIGDARNVAVQDGTVDAIITSPPYLNAIDYLRTSKFSLIFFGDRLSDLRRIRGASIGTERGLAEGVLPERLDALVRQGVSDQRRRPLVRRYVHDLSEILAESARVLKPGGSAIFVMGPSILSRRQYDSADVVGLLAKEAGFDVLGHSRRDFAETRRTMPPPRRSRRSETVNDRMSCELFVAIRKPR